MTFKPLATLTPIEAELDHLIQQLAISQARCRITDALIAGKIDSDEFANVLIGGGLVEFTPLDSEAPETSDLAEKAWADARAGFGRLNREADIKRGRVFA